MASWLVATIDACWPMRRPKDFLVSSVTKPKPQPLILTRRFVPLPGRLLLFLVCNLHYFFFHYFFHILLQPRYSTLLILPPTDQTSVVYWLRPMDGNTLNLHFFLGELSAEIRFTLGGKPGYWKVFNGEPPPGFTHRMTSACSWVVSAFFSPLFCTLRRPCLFFLAAC